MHIITAIADRVDWGIRRLLIVLLLVLVAAISMQVINRYVLELAWPFLQWLIVFCITWLTLLGSAVALRRREHFYVDILEKRIASKAGKRTHRLLLLIVDGACTAAIIGTGWGFLVFGLLKKSPATGFQMVYTYAGFFAGGIALAIFIIEQIVRELSGENEASTGEAD